MIIPKGVNIPMPQPFGGNPPAITREPKGEGVPGEHVTVQLVGEIGPVTQFLELINVLDTATENDEVEIMIDTPGGDVYTTMILGAPRRSLMDLRISASTFIFESIGTMGPYSFSSESLGSVRILKHSL